MGHIDHRGADALVQLFELAAQFPFQMRVDHGQRFVEHHHIHIVAHQPPPHGDLLLGIGRQASGAFAQNVRHFEHVGNLGDAGFDPGFGHTPVTQRKRQIVIDGHRVVNHRELEHLRDIAFIGGELGDIRAVE